MSEPTRVQALLGGRAARRVEIADGEVDRLYTQRYVAIVVLAIGTLLVPGFSPYLPVVILVVAGGSNWLAHRITVRDHRYPIWLQPLDMVACLAFVSLSPESIVPVLLVMLTVVSLAATLGGVRLAVVVAAMGAAGLALVHGALGIDMEIADTGLILVTFGFGVTALMIATSVGRLATAEDDARAQLRDVVDNLDAILWVRDPREDRFTYVSRRGPDLLGWPEDHWLSPGFWPANIHPEDRDRVAETVRRCVDLSMDIAIGYRFQAADGRWVNLQDRIQVVEDPGGEGIVLQGMSVDVTDRVQIEQRVRQYADIVDRIDMALLVLGQDEHGADPDPDEPLRLVAANPAAERLVTRELSGLIGATVEEAFPALAGSRLRRQLGDVATTGNPVVVDDLVLQPEGRERRVVTLRAFPLPDRAVGVSLQDVTEAVAAAEALRRQALYDGLTGLPNRRLLDAELHRLVRSSPATGERVALLVMDLDQFKEVNDALGHHIGDQLLRAIGDRLTDLLDDALVARLGGDEFAVVLQGQVDEAQARAVADRIRATLASPFLLDEVRLQSNASIGVALFPEHAADVATLIQRADVAMYLAKRGGLGVAAYRADHDRSSVERLTIISDLPDAADFDQLRLHYQPCLDLRGGRPMRVEALVRWEHPTFGLLGPDQFIELAELSGAIQPITRWVIGEGLRAAATLTREGHRLGLAVNLSVRNLYDPDLVPFIAHQLRVHGVEPQRLVVELTETELMDDPSLARDVFHALGELGVATSIDDFGTGYSSLTYLRDLPLQELKIDRSFVSGMHANSDEFTIVRSMIDLGHNLGLDVVAEGVEYGDDLTLLRRLGCDYAQGFHISHPLPLPKLLDWLERHEVVPVS